MRRVKSGRMIRKVIEVHPDGRKTITIDYAPSAPVLAAPAVTLPPGWITVPIGLAPLPDPSTAPFIPRVYPDRWTVSWWGGNPDRCAEDWDGNSLSMANVCRG